MSACRSTARSRSIASGSRRCATSSAWARRSRSERTIDRPMSTHEPRVIIRTARISPVNHRVRLRWACASDADSSTDGVDRPGLGLGEHRERGRRRLPPPLRCDRDRPLLDLVEDLVAQRR